MIFSYAILSRGLQGLLYLLKLELEIASVNMMPLTIYLTIRVLLFLTPFFLKNCFI